VSDMSLGKTLGRYLFSTDDRPRRYRLWKTGMSPMLALVATACVSTGQVPAKSVPSRPAHPIETPIELKAAWILRLEQQRVLADPAAGADLATLIRDVNPGVRRRTALALGRIGGAETLP